MGVTEILLLFVVSVTVMVSFILDSFERNNKTLHETDQGILSTSTHVLDDFENKTQTVEERYETESPVPETSNFCSEREEFFDDWEGIERTELEKLFGKAIVFTSNADKFDEDVKLQFYGLQKVVLEGPCYESQPMALKVSARSKWNAWEKLGNMSRDMAMEKYIEILSMVVPDWEVDEINQ